MFEKLDQIATIRRYQKKNQDSLLKTIGLSIAAETSVLGVTVAMNRMGIVYSGGISKEISQEEMETSPFLAFSIVAASASLEETLFRLVPSKVLDYLSPNSGLAWNLGVPTSFLFALAHLPNRDNRDRRGIPAPQFLNGLYFWYQMRRNGFFHSFVAHSTTITYLWILNKIGLFRETTDS